MASIVQLFDDAHQKVQMLLPWYVTGTLDDGEVAMVDAHLLACVSCQAELASERLLKTEIAGLPVDADKSWAGLRDKIASDARLRTPLVRRLTGLQARATAIARGWRQSSPWMQWAVGLQAAGLAGAAALLSPASPLVTARLDAPPAYHVLGAPGHPAAANLAVKFRPDTTVVQMRQILAGVGGRVVDGPTAADVYLLQVPAAGRTKTLAAFHAASSIQLAEPVDPEGPR
jgi:hypothetical protein